MKRMSLSQTTDFWIFGMKVIADAKENQTDDIIFTINVQNSKTPHDKLIEFSNTLSKWRKTIP